jgi:hypothetical protein
MTARRKNFVERPTYEDVARLLLKEDAPLWLNAHLEWWAQGMFADRLKEESQPTKAQMRKRLFALQAASKLIEHELASTSMREVLAIDLRGPLKDVSGLPFILGRFADHVEFVRMSSGLAQKDGTTKRGRNKARGPSHFSAKPPKNTRFQKGNKYYLKRSRHKPRDVAAIINETSKLPVEYREGGRTRKATWSELSFRALVRRAATGNLRSMEMVIDEFAHAQRVGDPGNQIIEVRDWLPDYPGQTGEQKTREFAEQGAAQRPSGGSPRATIRPKKATSPTWARS